MVGSAALGRALAGAAPGETHVALLMPNAVASVVAFMGLQAFGLVPCLLNISAGAAAMLSACRTAGVRTVISSRGFVEKGRLARVVERMSQEVRFIWLEDVRDTIGLRAKLRAKRDARRARGLPGASTDPDAPAVVLFTSGSEGTPKGVVLSHRNLLANCAQLASVIDFHGGDIVFNAMPMFHAFGLTGGTILPLISGVRTFHYPTPLHYRIVPALIYDTDATICFSTDTFLNGWARYAHPYDFYAMRYIFAGAEKVREETRHLFADRFGARVLEGYGATETAPVLALNTAMQCRPGTVGRLLPGIEWRLEPVAGIETGGRLHRARPQRHARLSARNRARCVGAARGRVVRHRRHRVGRCRRLHDHRRPGEAVCQDRRRDGVDDRGRSAGGVAVAGATARGDQRCRYAQGRGSVAGDHSAECRRAGRYWHSPGRG